jgi:precorrin-4 C11-methyltransferase
MSNISEPSVYFIGAGPGALDLLTIRARSIISKADLVIWADSLVNPLIASLAKPAARVIGSANLTLDEIVSAIVDAAKAGLLVARVHSGDCSIYGAIQEQMAALDANDINYTVVPGVSSLFGAAAALQVELTPPETSQTVIITRAAGRTPVPKAQSLRSLARHQATLVVYLSVNMIEQVVTELLAGGYAPTTPVAVVYRATWPEEKIIRGDLSSIALAVRDRKIDRQALILVGAAIGPQSGKNDAAVSRLYSPDFSHGYRTNRSK